MIDNSAAIPRDDVALITEIVSAYVSNNSVPVADLPSLIAGVHKAVTGLRGGSGAAPAAGVKLTPVQIKKSITPDALISFIDDRPYKTLKRHLTKHGLDPQGYRGRYGLPADYPMTAATYSAQRSDLARLAGLGSATRRAANDAGAPEDHDAA